MGYKKGKGFNIEKARFFDEEYNMGLKEAKKFARSNYVTTGNIKPQAF